MSRPLHRTPRVCLAIPAFNAGATIRDVIMRALATRLPQKILVVNDGSTDRTREEASGLPRTEVIEHGRNRGYGMAQITLLRAFQQDESFRSEDIIVFLHSDGEMLPEEIGRILAPFFDDISVDCVTGSRSRRLARSMGFLPRGVKRVLWKRALDRVLTRYLNTAFDLQLSTYFGGFRGLRKRAINILPLDKLSHVHAFDIQFLAFAAAMLEMREVPITNVENNAISNYSSLVLLADVLRFAGRRKEVRAAYLGSPWARGPR